MHFPSDLIHTVSAVFSHANSGQVLNRPWQGRKGTGQTPLSTATKADRREGPFSAHSCIHNLLTQAWGTSPVGKAVPNDSVTWHYHVKHALSDRTGSWTAKYFHYALLGIAQACALKLCHQHIPQGVRGCLKWIENAPKENQGSKEKFPQAWKNVRKIFN